MHHAKTGGKYLVRGIFPRHLHCCTLTSQNEEHSLAYITLSPIPGGINMSVLTWSPSLLLMRISS